MKKSFLFMLIMLATVSTMRVNNILVVYFSCGGNTQALAEEIQRQTGGDIYRTNSLYLTPLTTTRWPTPLHGMKKMPMHVQH